MITNTPAVTVCIYCITNSLYCISSLTGYVFISLCVLLTNTSLIIYVYVCVCSKLCRFFPSLSLCKLLKQIYSCRWQVTFWRCDSLCGARCWSSAGLSGSFGVQGVAGYCVHPDSLPGCTSCTWTEVCC